jgi:CheY-like chemotaxis protein
VQRLIDLAGGEIGVDSEVGRGSRFWFTLPFLVTERVKAAEPMVIPNAAAERPPARPVHVLIAEDNRINQMLIRSMLQKHGHTAEVVENGRQALEAVMTRDFDIILMDMQMPEMDGEEATKAIRALPSAKSKLPVLALTADVMTEHRARYIQAGVDDVVAKPIDWRVLLEAIHHYTEKVYVL